MVTLVAFEVQQGDGNFKLGRASYQFVTDTVTSTTNLHPEIGKELNKKYLLAVNGHSLKRQRRERKCQQVSEGIPIWALSSFFFFLSSVVRPSRVPCYGTCLVLSLEWPNHWNTLLSVFTCLCEDI